MIIAGLMSLSLAAAPVIPVADGPPRFDIAASCRDVGKSGAGVGRPASACVDDEEKARDQLGAKWSQYPLAERDTCVEGAKLGGPPSYVQVITCLEMKSP